MASSCSLGVLQQKLFRLGTLPSLDLSTCIISRNFVAFLVLLPCGHCFSPRTKIVAPLIGAAVIVLLQAVVALDTSLSGTRVMVAAIASSAALGALTAPLTSATYALSSFLPPLYVQVGAHAFVSREPLQSSFDRNQTWVRHVQGFPQIIGNRPSAPILHISASRYWNGLLL